MLAAAAELYMLALLVAPAPRLMCLDLVTLCFNPVCSRQRLWRVDEGVRKVPGGPAGLPQRVMEPQANAGVRSLCWCVLGMLYAHSQLHTHSSVPAGVRCNQ